MNKNIFTKVLLLSTCSWFIFGWPYLLNAQVIITEFMYNPDGTDSGREWIEIFNSGSEPVDLLGYKLFENDTNHGLSAYDSDNLVLNSQEYAIIADKPDGFLADFSKNGLLIDSAFALNNTGEEFSIINSDGQNIDSVSYSVDWGGNGTGNSLQLNGSDWIPADPTPFALNKDSAENENQDTDDNSEANSNTDNSNTSETSSNSTNTSTHSSVVELSNYKPKIDLKVSAGRQRHGIINSPIEFELIHNQDSDNGLKAIWSTGDGGQEKGEKIKYVYKSSGTYNIVLNVETSDQKATSRTKVFVSEPDISLNLSKSGKTVDVLLINNTKNELNLGNFYLIFGEKKFKIASDTIVDSQKTLNLKHQTTGFEADPYQMLPSENNNSNSKVTLYYPNSEKVIETDYFSPQEKEFLSGIDLISILNLL